MDALLEAYMVWGFLSALLAGLGGVIWGSGLGAYGFPDFRGHAFMALGFWLLV